MAGLRAVAATFVFLTKKFFLRWGRPPEILRRSAPRAARRNRSDFTGWSWTLMAPRWGVC